MRTSARLESRDVGLCFSLNICVPHAPTYSKSIPDCRMHGCRCVRPPRIWLPSRYATSRRYCRRVPRELLAAHHAAFATVRPIIYSREYCCSSRASCGEGRGWAAHFFPNMDAARARLPIFDGLLITTASTTCGILEDGRSTWVFSSSQCAAQLRGCASMNSVTTPK